MTPSAPPATWRLAEPHPGTDALAQALDLPPLVAAILAQRGYHQPEDAAAFINPRLSDLPDPSGLCGLQAAMELLAPAIEQGKTIGVAGDYDADGVSATALMVDFLRQIGAPVVWSLPHRVTDGYGFNPAAAERLAAAGAELVVTVDCGISDQAGVARAHQLGMPVVISDHHALPPGPLVDAEAVINPHQAECRFPPHLAGVGLAFYLAAGLRAELRQRGHFHQRTEPNLRHSLDLVALGTCADVVELVDGNRIMVAEGVKVLAEGRRVGLRALMRTARQRPGLDARDVSFGLAPRINAAGRMDHAALACRLLLCANPAEAESLAGRLEQLNRARRQVEQAMLDQALELLADDPRTQDRACIVLGHPDWHRGVLGIVASRLLEATGRPVMLFALENGHAVGSGRSLAGFHLQKALGGLQDILVHYGGHAMAAGATLASDDLPALARGLDQAATQRLQEIKDQRVLAIEAAASLAQLQPPLVEPLSRLAPFGQGNPEPLVMVSGARVASAAMLKGRHLKLQLAQNGHRAAAIAFNWSRPQPPVGQELDLALQLKPSTFRPGTLDMVIKDLRPAGDA